MKEKYARKYPIMILNEGQLPKKETIRSTHGMKARPLVMSLKPHWSNTGE